MPSLNDSDAGTLAEKFDFSGGGEIDNVILKATMNEILNGESPDNGYLLRVCSEERFGNDQEQTKILLTLKSLLLFWRECNLHLLHLRLSGLCIRHKEIKRLS